MSAGDPYRDPITAELAAIRKEIRSLREELAKRPVAELRARDSCIPKRKFWWPHQEVPQPHKFKKHTVQESLGRDPLGEILTAPAYTLICERCGKKAEASG